MPFTPFLRSWATCPPVCWPWPWGGKWYRCLCRPWTQAHEDVPEGCLCPCPGRSLSGLSECSHLISFLLLLGNTWQDSLKGRDVSFGSQLTGYSSSWRESMMVELVAVIAAACSPLSWQTTRWWCFCPSHFLGFPCLVSHGVLSRSYGGGLSTFYLPLAQRHTQRCTP